MTIRTLSTPLVSNGYTLDSAPNRLGWLDSSDPNTNLATLREQLEAEGYIWLKGFLDKDFVLDLRRRYFKMFEGSGFLAEGTDPVDGIYTSGDYNKQLVRERALEFVRWASYEAFCYAPRIWQFYEAFLGGPVYLHKRKIVRHTTVDDTGTGLRGRGLECLVSALPATAALC